MNVNTKILQEAEIVESEGLPHARFGHTVNQISKTSIVVFGGAISSPGNFTMSAELYLYDIPNNVWKPLIASNSNSVPHARAAHASATVRENQLLLYGGSIGNGQYAQPDLWFLDIKNNVDVSWMKVPVEGETPGPRYGHTMVYILPYLILFGGSKGGDSNPPKNPTMNDIWLFSTDVTPFKWIKLNVKSESPVGRLYHNACVLSRSSNDRSESMVIFGGRDEKGGSLKDLCFLRKSSQGQLEYEWEIYNKFEGNVEPIGRHQQCSCIFGPFLFVVGGRAGNQQATFDVFSFNSRRWYRLGTIGLFRHSIWTYFNLDQIENKTEFSLFIYGGFDSENNSQINSNLYKLDILRIFNKISDLKTELESYIYMLKKKSSKYEQRKYSKIKEEENRNHFELNKKVVVYNPENNDHNLVKEISYTKLGEVNKKISERDDEMITQTKKEIYNEENVLNFLKLMGNPDEEFNPNRSIITADAIEKLIDDSKKLMKSIQTVIFLRSPIKIYGSICGQFNDLIRLFNFYGRPSEFKGDIECMDYLFLGNIINRGKYSIEVFCLLMALKLRYPKNFHILRGSHEDLNICAQFGLEKICRITFGDRGKIIFEKICDLFEYFPLAAIINNQILCVHSGIGDNIKYINDLNIPKPISLSKTFVAQEVLWNVPEEYREPIYTFNNNTKLYRNKTFNEKKLSEFLSVNNLKMIIRSHSIVMSGIDYFYNNKAITIFSATNYCGEYGNNGAILIIKKNYEMQPKILTKEQNKESWIDYSNDCPPSPLRKNEI